jgi:hypothetical protein
MRHRGLVYVGVALGIVAATSSLAEPLASAKGSGQRSETITVECRSTGDLFVDYAYSGFPGGVRAVDFVVSNSPQAVDAVKGGSGEVIQAFNQSLLGTPVDWGTVSAQLLGQNGRVIAGSTAVWNSGTSVTC